MIKEFTVYGLHGERNIRLNFDKDEPYKILVAENGYGKTSLLNLFYGILSVNLYKIKSIDFEKVEITFHGKSKIKYVISKDEISLENLELSFESSAMVFLKRNLGEQKAIEFFQELIVNNFTLTVNLEKTIEDKLRDKGIRRALIKDLKNIYENHLSRQYLKNSRSYADLIEIKDRFDNEILYLPTYRRIEESLSNLYSGERKLDFSDFAVNFGMSDVEERIKVITDEILNSSRSEFLRMNGQMLSQLVSTEEINITDEMIKYIKNKSIDVLLDRIPEDDLPKRDKERIKSKINEASLKTGENRVLFSFIYNMAKADDKQKHNEQLIENFIKICNKYLVNKRIIYDNRKVSLSIVRNNSQHKTVSIHNLSSGEKQIISLFAKIYLSETNNFAIFFDEPELSLSIEWQKMLLKDIIDSNKCTFLFATTHSPFIFDQLIHITSDLSEHSEELN